VWRSKGGEGLGERGQLRHGRQQQNLGRRVGRSGGVMSAAGGELAGQLLLAGRGLD